jgi:hypothetical protein
MAPASDLFGKNALSRSPQKGFRPSASDFLLIFQRKTKFNQSMIEERQS